MRAAKGAKVTARPEEFKLGFLIHDLHRLRRVVADRALKPYGVTRSQWWALANLSRQRSKGMVQTELANLLEVSKVAIGGLLDRLEANGYIERLPDAADRRAKRVSTTPAGRDVLSAIQLRTKALNKQMTHGISRKEILSTIDVLTRMKEQLQSMDAEMRLSGDPDSWMGAEEHSEYEIDQLEVLLNSSAED